MQSTDEDPRTESESDATRETSSQRQARFTQIYRERLWAPGIDGPVSGPGSTTSWASNARRALTEIIRDFEIHSVLDVGCGDLNWLKDVDLSRIRYLGVDIVEELIQMNRESFSSKTNFRFEVIDAVSHIPAGYDLVFCRHVLTHLDAAAVIQVLRNISAGGARYLMATTFLRYGVPEFDPSAAAPETSVPYNFLEAPFSLPDPVKLFVEGGHSTDRQFLGLWSLPFSMGST